MPKKGGKKKGKGGPKPGFNREPTELETKFVKEYLCNPKSETYLNPVKSAYATGYKGIDRQTEQKVGKILCRPAVMKLVTTTINATVATIATDTTMTRIKYENELCIFLDKCKELSDLTNWKGALELWGKYMQFLTDKHLVTVEVSRQLSDSYLKELRELSKLSMSGSVIDAELSDSQAATRLLQAQSGVVSSPCGPIDDDADIHKSSNSNDLDNSESDNKPYVALGLSDVDAVDDAGNAGLPDEIRSDNNSGEGPP